MTSVGILQIVLFFGLILACTKPLGAFMAKVFDGERTFLHPVLRWLEALTYKIAGMQDLRDNTDGFPYGKLTDQDIEKLLLASKSDPGYPVTREFIIKNKLLMFPPFWVFDRKKGVWTNEGIRMLNADGTIQTIFYTINDQ